MLVTPYFLLRKERLCAQTVEYLRSKRLLLISSTVKCGRCFGFLAILGYIHRRNFRVISKPPMLNGVPFWVLFTLPALFDRKWKGFRGSRNSEKNVGKVSILRSSGRILMANRFVQELRVGKKIFSWFVSMEPSGRKGSNGKLENEAKWRHMFINE